MLWFNTRRIPDTVDTTLCGRRIGKTRACSRPATHHHLMAWPSSATGYKGVMLCARHTAECTTSRDRHVLAPICHNNPSEELWWQESNPEREGFCFHPEEEAQPLRELSTITRGVNA